jgi:hypothetical protein
MVARMKPTTFAFVFSVTIAGRAVFKAALFVEVIFRIFSFLFFYSACAVQCKFLLHLQLRFCSYLRCCRPTESSAVDLKSLIDCEQQDKVLTKLKTKLF